MRLKCEVTVTIRRQCTCNVRKTSRPSQALITVGKEGQSKINMVISTGKNRSGTKYQLSGNVMGLYAGFADAGKGMIVLVNPAQNICIRKADPIQVKNMLTIVCMVAKGEDISKYLTMKSIQPPSTMVMKTLKAEMVISAHQEYPLTATLPSGLHNLTSNQVTRCSKRRLDPTIRDLRHLSIFKDTLISKLPDDFAWRDLSELDLSSNALSAVPPALYRSCMKDSLNVLNLKNNNLTELPAQICQMEGLVRLEVDDNKLSALPPTIGDLSELNILSAQRNQISYLPWAISRLSLEVLDLFGNPIQQLKEYVLVSSNLGIPKLAELASRSIRRWGITYTEEDLPSHLVFYLNNARQCWCGLYCFETCALYLCKCDLSRVSREVQAWNILGNTTVPVGMLLCSARCLEDFQRNPFAYWG